MQDNYIPIGKAAKILGVNPATLRNWDKNGKFTSMRTPTGRRVFSVKKIRIFLKDSLYSEAFSWASDEQPREPEHDFYCPNSSVFQARLSKLEDELRKVPGFEENYNLIIAAAGEIGNNSFDHNIGNWSDIPGIFFGYDTVRKEIVLADRGQGILKTLKRVKPELENDEQALNVAFTEIISGRAPEERGNGLKFVRKIIAINNMELFFQNGNASLSLSKKSQTIEIKQTEIPIKGCFASITF
ncbi:MAG: helix-turn-helix domain-containing protein [Candidatus Moranbacteria bacterium]|nr:helix-turn-helix domain-containing protein [Candidatus Moranbacteria bacterium]